MSSTHTDQRALAGRHWALLAPLAATCSRRLVAAVLRTPAAKGLTESDWLVLARCEDAGEEGVCQVQLCHSAGVSPAKMSALVERLRQMGLLTSRRSQKDRRRQIWTLTPTAIERVRLVYSELGALLAPLTRHTPDPLRERLHELLRSIAEFDELQGPAIHRPGAAQGSTIEGDAA